MIDGYNNELDSRTS